MIVSIYLLTDPDTGQVRYVGKTGNLPHRRLAQHLCAKDHSHRTSWIKSVLSRGKKPLLLVVEEVSLDNAIAAESEWIGMCRSWGCDLTNTTAGGEGTPGIRLSLEHKRKIGEANSRALQGKKRAPFSESHRLNMSKGQIRRWNDVGRQEG